MTDEKGISLDKLYVIASYGYHGEPGTSDGRAYSSKEEAQDIMDQLAKSYPRLRYSVMGLQSYIWDNLRYTQHRCEIC
jgi:hypothetical protein